MASKRKGLSLEEKRQKMLDIFFESKDVFTLKELEKIGSKAGVVSNTIKDVVQSLVDDRLVDIEKIGSGNYYWAFPSKALVAVRSRADELAAALAADNALCNELELRHSPRAVQTRQVQGGRYFLRILGLHHATSNHTRAGESSNNARGARVT
jgi:hypothetical protein